MAAFASCRRSGWVRLLVVILCALFIFATLAAPPAQALGVESVAVFGLASVLSAATAALGFKLASNEQGQATLQKMVQDFKTVAWATGFVLVGSKLNGLQHGMDYIKMQVQNGKTYLDSRVFAWVQQWLAQNGVYNSGDYHYGDYAVGDVVKFSDTSWDSLTSAINSSKGEKYTSILNQIKEKYNLDLAGKCYYVLSDGVSTASIYVLNKIPSELTVAKDTYHSGSVLVLKLPEEYQNGVEYYSYYRWGLNFGTSIRDTLVYGWQFPLGFDSRGSSIYCSNYAPLVGANDTGLSGTDTLGKDVVDLTLDQVLQKLKEWAQDWFDAGADSATNAATGALDLPLTVATGAATANPSIAEDGPLVWFPPFSVPIPNLRTGETDTKTVDQGKENASSVETSTDVAENQSVIDSLVNWALSYISPDTGLFSKFPLCVPYDAYLLVTSSLGVDSVGSDSIFGASPGDLEGVVSQDIETYSDFQPIINIHHDFELDGVTYPLDMTIDLTPWQPLVTFFREGMALLLVAELIGSEFKRIRGH